MRRDGGVGLRDEAVLAEDHEGRPRLWQGVMFEVTERKRIEAALHEIDRSFVAVSGRSQGRSCRV